MFKFLFQSSNIVARTAAQFAVVGMAGSIGVSVAATSASANLDAIATNSGQTINSGTLSLIQGVGSGSLGFGKNLTGMLPGDSLGFNVNVTNGAIAAQNLTLSMSDSVGSILTTDASKSFQVKVESCGVAWSGSTCTSPTTLVNNIQISTINTDLNQNASVSLVSGTIPANQIYYLRFTVTMPSSINETTTNGNPPANSIQGLNSNIIWKFRIIQASPIAN